jgi:hypothetical protein
LSEYVWFSKLASAARWALEVKFFLYLIFSIVQVSPSVPDPAVLCAGKFLTSGHPVHKVGGSSLAHADNFVLLTRVLVLLETVCMSAWAARRVLALSKAGCRSKQLLIVSASSSSCLVSTTADGLTGVQTGATVL